MLLNRFLFFLLLFFFCSGKSQSLFDYQHTLQFANYLKSTGNYSMALSEYERALFLKPGNDTIVSEILDLYLKTGKPETGLRKALHFDYGKPGPKAQYKIAQSFIVTGVPGNAFYLADTSRSLTIPNAEKIKITSLLLNYDFKKSGAFLESSSPDLPERASFLALQKEGSELKFRSPLLASGFSAIVPGTGKIYSGEVKDGIISFLIVAGNAYQAYRGFSKKGASSVHGWVFGGLGMGFYLGNIYGSYKSAIRYNQNKKKKYSEKVIATFNHSELF